MHFSEKSQQNLLSLNYFSLFTQPIFGGKCMITIISFLLTLIGSINWLMIGLLQYDFVAGIFGYQASILSRIVYIIVGASSLVLVFKLFKGKGTLNVLSKRNKKDLVSKIEKVGKKDKLSPAYNVESGEESIGSSSIDEEDYEYEKETKSNHPTGLFDEHFDDRGRL